MTCITQNCTNSTSPKFWKRAENNTRKKQHYSAAHTCVHRSEHQTLCKSIALRYTQNLANALTVHATAQHSCVCPICTLMVTHLLKHLGSICLTCGINGLNSIRSNTCFWTSTPVHQHERTCCFDPFCCVVSNRVPAYMNNPVGCLVV